MAKQHFYSRVPARVSMYNRADGFDTFAHSEGLEREFIERELAPVYENKLSKNDVSIIRKNEMPCVYTQCCTRSGTLVQNCIRFLPLDYTGERSAYLSHSLIYSPEEKNLVLSSKEDTTFNPNLFTTDIDGFEITAANAAPNSEYPEQSYLPGQAQSSMQLVTDVDPETAKAFLYAILYALCGKGKNIYFKLKGDNAQLSLRSVGLFNEILSILPYQLRGSLSFVSHINDPTQYANFKLKGVSAQFQETSAVKGVYFDFQTKLVMGLHHDEVVANKPLLSFFYSLLENKALRAEFLNYMERATAAVPSLQSLNLKTLSNLVFLFQCSCGLFPEQEILPSDTMVYDYLCAYEKYRAALNEEYRMQAYKCLLRYPQNHLAIPKNIFAKVSRLYSAESRAAKRIFMNIVLELIHTDIMRDKLFTFIRSNYQAEDEDMKQTIIADLSRVFYGGFLQTQLLTFFSEQFETESEESKSLIVEKLLLSIRTPAVQGRILAFVDQHYENMSEAHRCSFYDTFLEMLPECDALAHTLVQVVNHHVAGEAEARKAALTQKLTDALESDYRKKEHRLMPILAAYPGFCQDLVLQLAFGPWQGRKLHAEYLALLSQQDLAEKTAALVRIFDLMPDLPDDTTKKLLEEAAALYQADAEKRDLYAWLDTAAMLSQLPEAFAAQLNEAVILPAVCATACDAFNTKVHTDGISRLEAYAAQNPAVQACENYRIIQTYNRMLHAAAQCDDSAAAQHLEQLMPHTALLPTMAAHMRLCAIDAKTQAPETVLRLELLQHCLHPGSVQLDKLYQKRAEGFSQQYFLQHGAAADPTKAAQDSAVQAMTLLLQVCQGLCRESQRLNALLCAPDSGLEALAAAFTAAYGKGAAAWVQSQLAPDSGSSTFAACLSEKLRAQKPAGTSLFSKLFGKKK